MINRICLFLLLTLATSIGTNLADEPREWVDSTGNFKIQATLIEQRDGQVYLKTTEGKTFKIPVDRLSAADQEYLKGSANPFQPADIPMSSAPESGSFSNDGNTNSASSSSSGWANPPKIDWSSVPELDRGFGNEAWSYTPPENNALPFECKRSTLPKKSNFFEGMRRLKINPLAGRCVAGYTVSFSVPKSLSRVSLVDLPSGKAINSESVECNMCPLAVLNDGKTILMHGTGDRNKGEETQDQLQLWRLNGKKVIRSQIWIPFEDTKKSFGKTVNSGITQAIPIEGNLVLLVNDNSHLVCVDIVQLKPVWHARLSRNYSLDLTTDRKQLLLLNDHTLHLVDPATGESKSRLFLDDKPHLGWPKARLNPTADKILLTFTSQLRVIDLRTGQMIDEYTKADGGPISPNSLSYVDDEFALLNNSVLFHIPSRITVCEYQNAAKITTLGGTEFVGLLGDSRGLIVPTTIPHPKAADVLEQAIDDPSVFLIHPGVQVALDVTGTSSHRNTVEPSLRQSAEKAGFQLSPNAPIRIKATISGPKQEAVSYIARGSYVANVYTSKVDIMWQGKPVWSRSGTNIPGVLSTSRGQSIQDKLTELGQKPNLDFFKHISFPKLLQAPGKSGTQSSQNALLVSKFTLNGLVDSK